jgi:hypothetical protein
MSRTHKNETANCDLKLQNKRTDFIKITENNAGENFTGRTLFASIQCVMPGNEILGIALSVGNLWRQHRRYALHVLRDFGFGKNVMQHKINIDIDRLIEYLKVTCSTLNTLYICLLHSQAKCVNGSATLNPTHALTVAIASIIANLTLNERYTFESDQMKYLKQLNDESLVAFMNPLLILVNTYPWLQYIPLFGHFGIDELKRATDGFRKFIFEHIERHKLIEAERVKNNTEIDFDNDDYMAAFLRERTKREKEGIKSDMFELVTYTHIQHTHKYIFSSDEQLFCCVWDMWQAGTETTVTTMEWGILYLCLHDDIQKRVRKEIEQVRPL